MHNNSFFRRALSLLLVVTMLAGFAVPAGATDTSSELHFEIQQIDNSSVTASLPMTQMGGTSTFSNTEEQDPNETVRVSIQLEKAATIDAGFQLMGIAENASAMHYRSGLKKNQEAMTATIERKVLNGQELDVVWNLTLAANIISANVPRSAIEKIAALDGVRAVVEETRYEPQVVSMGGEYSPNMAISGQMTGASQLWEAGYTGAGMRIAIIDTGLDTDHQSFAPDAFEYGLGLASEASGIDYSAGLLDAEEIASVLKELNAYKRQTEAGLTLTAEELYINAKAPYGYNYADGGLDVTHDHDASGEHGSHVAGIASANRYLSKDGAYVDALQEVHVAGNAPDAQLLTMKVFGSEGGAFDADILASIEDALLLGADAINLSLGSSLAGRTYCSEPVYQELFDRLEKTDTVVSISAGNYGYWAETTYPGYLFSDDANFATGGEPGTYENSLSVASVDNDGTISGGLVVGEETFGYTEELTDGYSAYGNAALTGLDTSADAAGTDLPFVFIDGCGYTEDYAGIDLTGKVVFLSRGELSFVEKANNAVSLGAAAVIICDNQPGVLAMDLTGYSYTAPVVSIAMGLGDKVKAAAAQQITDAGLKYYTGTVTVIGAVSGHYNDSAFKSMSIFSSWGVPSDLALKPEITAPGGNIYSVNGLDTSGTAYELMSGTSMAAPQVAGMAALLLQYLQENDLDAADLTDRGLAQALLMSTAQPLRNAENGGYYAVMQQGSGLANVADAMTTPVYITVDGMDDGKVKVELGDDAARTGTYTFSFKLNNLSDETVSYQLSADIFTQDVFTGEDGNDYLDTLTRTMGAEAVFTVNGETLTAPTLDYDFNSDGKVTTADAQLLLDHVTVGTALAANAENADISGDGTVNTYDVHLFLNLCRSAVEVGANSSVTVDVTITLTDDEKALLAQKNPAGAYVQAFVLAEPMVTAEGEKLPTLSIPVLGYHGGWNEPSMFDETCYTTYFTGEETREPYWATSYVNGVGITYGDDQNVTYYFGGNPITADDVYRPERNAVNLERGDYFRGWDFGLIRNAGAHRATVVNTTTGEELFYEEGGAVYAAYYSAALGGWLNVPQSFVLDFAPDMEEDERGLLTFSAVVELYGDDWTKADTMEMPFVVDNTAPVITDDSVVVDTENNVLRLTVTDNQHVAGVCIYDVTGRDLLAYCGADQDAQPGETVTMEVPLDEVDGYKFVIQVVDYAVNKTTYKLKQTIGDPEPLPGMLYYSTTFHEWEIGDWPATTAELISYNGWFTSAIDPVAAVAVGSYIFMVDEDQNLYAAPGDNMFDIAKIRTLEYPMVDMAYDAANGIIYGLTDTGMLVTIDRMTGALTEIGTVYMGSAYYQAASLAYDGNGTFYATKSGSYPQLYSFTLETWNNATYIGYIDTYSYGNQCLEYSPTEQVLYYVCNNSSNSSAYELWKINPNDFNNQEYRYFYGNVSAIVFPDWSDEANAWFDPSGKVTSITISKEAAEVFVGKTVQLSASVSPWNVADRGVTFSTSDASIATVDANGLVTGVGEGAAIITAASAADPSITAQCSVTVSVLDVTIEGVLIDENDVSKLFSWNTLSSEGWVGGTEMSEDAIAATLVPGTNTYYMLDPNKVTRKMDMTTGEMLEGPFTYMPDNYYYPHGITYSPMFSTEEAPMVYYVRNGQLSRPRTLGDTNYVSFFSYGYDHDFLAGACVGGTEKYIQNGEEYDSEIVYLIDDTGMVFRCNIYKYNDSFTCKYSKLPSTLPEGVFAAGKEFSSLVLGHDGALYLSAFAGSFSNLYRLAYNEDEGIYEAMDLGSFGDNVYPAVVLKATSNAPAVTAVPEAIYEAVIEETSPAAEPAGEETVPATEPAAEGSLQAITVSDAAAAVDGGAIVADCVEDTLTVPVYALDSTNGLFELSYDTNLLTLVSAESGAMMTCVDVSTDGIVRVGYAESGVINAVVTKLIFSVNAEETVQSDLVLTTEEDCDKTPETDETISLDLPGHNYESVVTEATCTEPGYTTHTCVKCGHCYVDSETSAKGHSCITVVTAPTCTEPGYTTHTCTECDHVVVTDEVPALGHSFSEWTETKAPTCTADGEEQRTCSTCGEVETQAIKATGHTAETIPGKAPSCTETGLTEGEKCAVCDEILTAQEKIPATGHSYVDVVTKPTKTEKGYTTHTCENCGHRYVDSYTDPTPDASADTGDAFSTIWILLMLVSLAGAAALILNRKRVK